jgi:hypothetical protein
MHSNHLRFFFILCLCEFALTLLLGFTSDGWSVAFLPMLYVMYVAIPLLIGFSAALALHKNAGNVELHIPRWLIYGFGVISALALMFNIGDCGDSGNAPHLFFQYFTNDVCESRTEIVSPTLLQFSQVLLALLIFIQCLVVIAIAWVSAAHTPNGTTSRHPFIRRIYRSLLWILLTVCCLLSSIFAGHVFVYGL